MDPTHTIKFNIGDKYENENGLFEVVEINGGKMVIRYTNGDTVLTTMRLQKNIQLRRMYEKSETSSSQKSTPKVPKRGTTSAGKKFAGLTDADFSTNVAGTHWRSQKHLGGAVTRMLPAEGYRFKSWALYNWPIVHWADERHRNPDNPGFQSKFFVKLDEECLLYGLHIARGNRSDGTSIDFDNFITWLRVEENNAWLLDIGRQYHLSVSDLEKDFTEYLKPDTNTWQIEDRDAHKPVANLSEFFDILPPEQSINPVIAARLPKEQAILKEGTIAEDIANIFEALLPVYAAAAAHCLKPA